MAKIGTDLGLAEKLLKTGKQVAIPTETVYGLAANALDATAVAGIFEIKQRPHFDPLIVHLHNKDQLQRYCKNIPEIFEQLYQAFCPGPITFILPKKDSIPDLVTSGQPTVGVRFPRHPLTRSLLLKLQLPLAAPSANPFGYVSPTTAHHVDEQLGEKVSYILDGGSSAVGLESTIIDLTQPQPKILRLGGLSLEEIEKLIGKVEVTAHSSSNPKAPGMLSAHYSPGRKLLIGDVEKLISENRKAGTAVISFSKQYSTEVENHILSTKGDLTEAASKLFKVLRLLDRDDVKLIIAERFPDEGLGRAINDRLARAAAT